MDRVDAALGMEQWDEKATLARAAHAACFSTSCETSNPSTLYCIWCIKNLYGSSLIYI